MISARVDVASHAMGYGLDLLLPPYKFLWVSYAIDVPPWRLRGPVDDGAGLSPKDMSGMLMPFSCPSASASVLVGGRTLASRWV